MEADHINPKGQPSYQVENLYDLFLLQTTTTRFTSAMSVNGGHLSPCTTGLPRWLRRSETNCSHGTTAAVRRLSSTTLCTRWMELLSTHMAPPH